MTVAAMTDTAGHAAMTGEAETMTGVMTEKVVTKTKSLKQNREGVV